MQKKHLAQLKIDDSIVDLVITLKKLRTLPDCFISKSSYPEVYFKPKDGDFELFSLGATFTFEHIPKIKSPHYIPFITLGEKSNTLCFIPQKWVIKKKELFYFFEVQNVKEKDLILQALDLKVQDKEGALLKIAQIIQAIKRDEVKKCVFSQIQKKAISTSPDLLDFASLDKSGIFYYVKLSENALFCGISPEWIYKRQKNKIYIDAIAGTSLKENLSSLEDQKIIEEFNFVKVGIIKSLKDLIINGSFLEKDQILFANHLAHRFNYYHGQLHQGVCDQALLNTLHPTPAICGFPKDESLKLIDKIEISKRYFFGAPVGVFNEKLAFMALGIRSCYIQKNEAFFFSGAGIVRDSDPEEEWKELMNKINLMQSIIK
jgi:isochorismate synthase EntC